MTFALDGANRLQIFFYITLPFITPILVISGMFRLIDSVKAFPLVFLLTGGGPANATHLLATYASRGDRIAQLVVQRVEQALFSPVDSLGDAAKTAGASAKERFTGEDLPETLHRGTDGRLHADTTGFGPGPNKLP